MSRETMLALAWCVRSSGVCSETLCLIPCDVWSRVPRPSGISSAMTGTQGCQRYPSPTCWHLWLLWSSVYPEEPRWKVTIRFQPLRLEPSQHCGPGVWLWWDGWRVCVLIFFFPSYMLFLLVFAFSDRILYVVEGDAEHLMPLPSVSQGWYYRLTLCYFEMDSSILLPQPLGSRDDRHHCIQPLP